MNRFCVSTRAALLGASMCVAPWTMAAPALAQDGASEDEDVIVVTARRREESIQDVPLAVSAFSADELDKAGAADITNLQTATPNVTFVVSRGTNSTLTTFIRGVGQQDPLWGFEPGVGLYVDDVYVARPQAAVLDIFDIQRVEVLRGPQGTLYGRNTIGGAIKYVTRRHGADPQFRGRVNVGSYNQLDYILSGSAPLGGGLSIGGAVARYARDGYGENLFTGQDHYNKDVLAGRLSLEFAPGGDFFFRLTGDWVDDDSNPKHGHRLLPGVTNGEPVLDDIYDTRGGLRLEQSVDTEGYSAQAEWDISASVTFKSITAYREGESSTPIDFDALPDPDFDVPARYYDDQFTQELQLLFDNERWSGVLGVYYLDGAASGEFDVILQALGLTIYQNGDVDKKSSSAFADFTYRFTDRWSISLGGRYTDDETSALVGREVWIGLGSGSFDPSSSSIFFVTQTDLDLTRTDSEFTPRVSVSFEPTDDVTLYASYSEGFKSGGFDPRAREDLDPLGLAGQGFGPEYVDSWEVGAKGVYFGGFLDLNAALFFADYTDQQITVQQGADSDGDGVNDTFLSGVFNAGASEYQGLELEGAAHFTDAFMATFSLGYIDAEIKEIISGDMNVADLFVTQNTPEFTGHLSLQYTDDLPDGMGSVSLIGSANYRDEYHIFNVPNQGFAPTALFPEGGPKLDPDSVTTFDASAVWTSEDERWRLGIHGRNLSDEEVRVALYNFVTPSQLGLDSAYTAFYAPPRTVTASLEVRF